MRTEYMLRRHVVAVTGSARLSNISIVVIRTHDQRGTPEGDPTSS